MPHIPYAPQPPVCISKGQGPWKAQRLHEACLSLGFGTDSGLELAFGLDLPVGARRSSNFKGQMTQGTFRIGTTKVLGSNSLSVKGGERGKRSSGNLSRKKLLRGTSTFHGATASLGTALCPCPPVLTLALSTALQNVSHSSRPTFLGFRMLVANLSSGLFGREIKTLAVGRVIEALAVVDRALEPTSLLCCSLRTCPWGRSVWGGGS